MDASFSRALNPVDRKTGNMFLRTYGYPLPREVLQAVRDLSRRQEGIGLSEAELRERLDRLRELHILPEHREQREIETDR